MIQHGPDVILAACATWGAASAVARIHAARTERACAAVREKAKRGSMTPSAERDAAAEADTAWAC